MTKKPLREPFNVLYRIQRGLSGYVSYLAACEMNSTFSEYVLYEPILRILTTRGYSAQSEVIAPGVPRKPTGDPQRIDFVARKKSHRFALEVKWSKVQRANVIRDYEKLVAFRRTGNGARAFLCVFGRYSHISNIRLNPSAFVEVMKPVWADLRITKFGCRVFETSTENAPRRHTTRDSKKASTRRRVRRARA
jgi:hypothetical protein